MEQSNNKETEKEKAFRIAQDLKSFSKWDYEEGGASTYQEWKKDAFKQLIKSREQLLSWKEKLVTLCAVVLGVASTLVAGSKNVTYPSLIYISCFLLYSCIIAGVWKLKSIFENDYNGLDQQLKTISEMIHDYRKPVSEAILADKEEAEVQKLIREMIEKRIAAVKAMPDPRSKSYFSDILFYIFALGSFLLLISIIPASWVHQVSQDIYKPLSVTDQVSSQFDVKNSPLNANPKFDLHLSMPLVGLTSSPESSLSATQPSPVPESNPVQTQQ